MGNSLKRFYNWLEGIGPDVAPTIEQSKAEGFEQVSEHSIFIAQGDTVNLGSSVRLHGVGQGSFVVMQRKER